MGSTLYLIAHQQHLHQPLQFGAIYLGLNLRQPRNRSGVAGRMASHHQHRPSHDLPLHRPEAGDLDAV